MADGMLVAPTIDPVCGMEVGQDKALSFAYEGETYFFCSADCKEEFEESPEDYLV